MRHLEVESIGEKVSILSLGTNKTGNKILSSSSIERDRIFLYNAAIDLGINLFDCAELYGGGYAEEILGKALKGKRDRVLICTKFNSMNSSKDNLRNSLENSLARLKTDYIDFYLAHWPNPDIPTDETISELEKFKKEGKIRAYGISNAEIEEISDFYNNSPIVIENEYNLIERSSEEKILPFCRDSGCLFMGYSPFFQGAFTENNLENIQMSSLTEKYECSLSQIILAWQLRKNIVSIIRTGNISHLRDNIRATELTISDEDAEILEDYFKPTIEDISLDRIKIDNRSYTTLEEAVNNEDNLIPSPGLLSRRADQGLNCNPIRVTKVGEMYRILDSFYMSEIKKYWAVKISKKHATTIKAYIFNDL